MPYIKLKQKAGEYVWAGRKYDAGKILEVTEKEAVYLVSEMQVANPAEGDEFEAERVQAEINKAVSKDVIGKMKIAMIRLGGMGDSFLLMCHAKAVKRKYPNSVLTVYIRDKFELAGEMEDVDRVVYCGNANWWDMFSDLLQKKYYDIIYDNRYVTKVFYRDEEKYADDKRITDKAFSPFRKFYDEWIRSSANLKDTRISTFDLFYKSTGLEGGEDDIRFPLQKEHFKFSQLLEGTKYVTLHNGSDVARQTKCWPTEHWSALAKMLIARGYMVVQVGRQFEEKIEGAKYLCGMTTLFETASLIAKAEFHVDTEGGLVHVAKGVGTRCVVLFGPTAKTCFAYEQNVNISSNVPCLGCWWSTDMWWRDCPKGHSIPPLCMTNLTPEIAMDGVKEVEKLPKIEKVAGAPKYDPNDVNERFALDLILDENHYKAEKHQWERINVMMDEVKGPRVLEVGAGDGYCSMVLAKRGYEVTSTEISEIRLDRMRQAGLNPVKADIKNLPFPDEFFDTVLCGEVLEHIPNWWEGMKELERVCKKDGRLVLSWPVHPDYDGIGMHLWSIRFFPVYRDKKLDFSVQTFQRIHRDGK